MGTVPFQQERSWGRGDAGERKGLGSDPRNKKASSRVSWQLRYPLQKEMGEEAGRDSPG